MSGNSCCHTAKNKTNCADSCPQPYWCTSQAPCFPSIGSVIQADGKPPPCGLGTNVDGCSSCCWDTTLCYPSEPACVPGTEYVEIGVPNEPVTFTNAQSEILALYNYSIQRFFSRMMKFVASYYDWLYCNGIYLSEDRNIESSNLKPLPPASLFTQWAQMAGWSLEAFDYLNVCNCLCGSFCDFINLLTKFENSGQNQNVGLLDTLVLERFTNAGCVNTPVQLGCGNLYTETDFVNFWHSVIFIINIIIKIVELSNTGDTATSEQVLANLCTCLLESVACTLSKENTGCNNNDCWDLDGNGSITEVTRARNPHTELCGKTKAASILLNNQLTMSQSYQQAIAAFIDFIQFVIFDRDCNKKLFNTGCDECCTINAGEYEDYMNARCRAATNNGNCVVCSSACQKYRRDDGYETALSVLYSLRCFFGLLGIDRGSKDKYVESIKQHYNKLASSLHTAYKESSKGDKTGKKLQLYPDCAAPQFCCSTMRALDVNCCNPTSKNNTVIINGVPSLDMRYPVALCGKPGNLENGLSTNITGDDTCHAYNGTWTLGSGANADYTFRVASDDDHDGRGLPRSGYNVCVLSAPCCENNTISCDTATCHSTSDAYFSSVC